MRKVFVLFIMSSVLLASCASHVADGENKIQESYSEAESEDIFSKRDYIFEKIALESYELECGKALGDIGFTKITDMSISDIEVDEDGNINETALISDSNGKSVLLSCSYISIVELWGVNSIVDPESGNHYWVPEDSEKYFDIYSYRTGELVSAKTEDFDVDKFLDDCMKEMDDISEDFDKALDELSDKYN